MSFISSVPINKHDTWSFLDLNKTLPAVHSSCQSSPCASSRLPPWSLAPCEFPYGSFPAAHPEAAEHWSPRSPSFGPDQAAPEPTARLGHSGQEERRSGKNEEMIRRNQQSNHSALAWLDGVLRVGKTEEEEMVSKIRQ